LNVIRRRLAAASMTWAAIAALSLAALPTLAAATSSSYAAVRVVDENTGRGVPLVRLCSTSNVCYWTDSNGVIAIDEPDFLGKRVFFSIESEGYSYQQKSFGTPGTTIDVEPGKVATLKIQRLNLAERLYRVTGEGIYHDSELAGLPVPPGQETLADETTGMDSVMYAVYRGQIFWLFGDTTRLSASLGNFATTCALTPLPSPATYRPEEDIPLRFFTRADGFVKGMAAIPGDGPKWLSALMIVSNATGKEALYARYNRVKNVSEVYDSGIAEFDDAHQEFRPILSTGPSPEYFANGRVTLVHVRGESYFYFSGLKTDAPEVRVRAGVSDILKPGNYEVFACDFGGCSWRGGTKPAPTRFYDIETDAVVRGKIVSLNWSRYCRRWIAIIWQPLGDVWYAESDTPTGPWSYARKIVSHPKQTFYWPGQIAPLDASDGRRIYIMGTYTQKFRGNIEKTPRYEYNQLLYGLSLDTPQIALPVARYSVSGRSGKFTKEQLDEEHLWPKVLKVVDFVDRQGRSYMNRNSPLQFDRDAQP
jgi:hypothetical protein